MIRPHGAVLPTRMGIVEILTELDVYKRQQISWCVLDELCRQAFILLPSLPMMCQRTVSYTHLDVYKRQLLLLTVKL